MKCDKEKEAGGDGDGDGNEMDAPPSTSAASPDGAVDSSSVSSASECVSVVAASSASGSGRASASVPTTSAATNIKRSESLRFLSNSTMTLNSVMAHSNPKKLGKKITRRLSLMAKMPFVFQAKLHVNPAPSDKNAYPGMMTKEGGVGGVVGGAVGGGASTLFRSVYGPLRSRAGRPLRTRPIGVSALLPDGSKRMIVGSTGMLVRQVFAPIIVEFRMSTVRVRLADSLAEVDFDADAVLLDGDFVRVDYGFVSRDKRGERDKRFCLTEGLLIDEREYVIALRGVEDIYGKPLKKLSSLTIEEHRSLFGGTIPICSLSAMLITKLEDALRSWDPGETRIGPLFSRNFWTQYEDYKEFYTKAKQILREKQREDEEFVEFCKLRRGAAKHTLDTLLDLPVQRLSQYEKYFQDLLKETRAEHPDHDDIARQAQKAKQLVRRAEGGPETDLDRIQDLFPQDTLFLHEKDPSNMKVKGLMRKRSVGVGAAARLQRALSTKALPSSAGIGVGGNLAGVHSPLSSSVSSAHYGSASMHPSAVAAAATASPISGVLPLGLHSTANSNSSPSNNNNQTPSSASSSSPATVQHPSLHHQTAALARQFVMEAAVQFTTGVQSQDRHLFLFNDLLLVAKSRSGGNFKLKDRVLICEMWLGSTNEAIDEVTELTRSRDTSFVIGWPTTNVVATFNTAATKDLWFNKLQEVIAAGKEREPSATTVQITYYDALNRIEYCKTLSVSPTDTARDCIRAALEHLEMGTIDASHFQLWVRTGHDDSPYPLIGHEYPFAIKMNCLRDYLATCDNENVDLNAVSNMMDSSCNYYSCDPSTRCQFILRNLRKESLYSVDSKKAKKSLNQTSKSPIRIHKMFRRSLTKLDSTDGASPPNVMTPFPGGLLFGQPLPKLCETETVPRPVMEMLLQLFLKGPFTHGIFRKSANARQVRELREQLDTNPDGIDWDQVPILTVSALLKDFLRSLPDCLLGSALFHEWLAVSQVPNGAKDKIPHIQGLFSKLPKENVTLLQHFLCVLHHIARRSGHNQMSASNLAVCVGPSLLWPANAVSNGSPVAGSGNAVAAALAMGPETSRLVPSLVELMIDRCADLFGHETLQLFGEAPPASSNSRQDSGAEESDSLHSGQGDSLERELMGEEPSPLPRKDKMSLTNLSRDSGLTMSDTQLYTPDEEENESTSSGHSGGEKSTYSSGHGSEKSGSEPIRYHHPPGNPSALYASVTRKPLRQQTQQQQQQGAGLGAGHDGATAAGSASGAAAAGSGSGGDYPPHVNVHHHKLTVSYSNPNCDTASNAQGAVAAAMAAAAAGGYAIYEEIGGGKSSAYNNPYFQRTDWTRKHAGLRKVGRLESGQPGGQQQQQLPPPPNLHHHLMPPPNRHSPLRRSASEESLLDKLRSASSPTSVESSSSSSRADSPSKRPALHRKGRAPMPPQPSSGAPSSSSSSPSHDSGAGKTAAAGSSAMRFSPHIALQHRIVIENTTTTAASGGAAGLYHPLPPHQHHNGGHVMHRSRSAHHLGADEEIESSRTGGTSLSGHTDFSQSGSRRISAHLADSCDSSTLSDDDSTPHVSRSNSRGKEFTGQPSSSTSAPGAGQPHLQQHQHQQQQQHLDRFAALDYGTSGSPSSSLPRGIGGGRHLSSSSSSASTSSSSGGGGGGRPEVNINRTGSTSTVKSTDSSSTLTNGSVCSNNSSTTTAGTSSTASTCRPPSYEETLNRRTARMGSPAKSSLGSPSTSCEQLMRGQQGQPNQKRSSKAEQLYHESWRIQPDEGLTDFVYASAAAARVEAHEDQLMAAAAAAAAASAAPTGPPPPLPPKQNKIQRSRPVSYGAASSSQAEAAEPIYAPVPLTRRRAAPASASASSSPSRASLMAKRHSVETQTEVGPLVSGGKGPLHAASAAATATSYGAPRRHSETPARYMRENSNASTSSMAAAAPKTQEKYVSSVRIGESPPSSFGQDSKNKRRQAGPGTPTPAQQQQHAEDMAAAAGYRGRLKRKEASVGTSPSPSPSSSSSSSTAGAGGVYSPRKSAGGVRAVLNARAAAQQQQQQQQTSSAAPSPSSSQPSSGNRSKSLPPSEERQGSGAAGPSRVLFYRDSSDTEPGDTSTSELDDARSWAVDSDSAGSDYVDPSLRKEISWSVSQLRALFGGGGSGGPEWRGSGPGPLPPSSPSSAASAGAGSGGLPPPYRHPPASRGGGGGYFDVKGAHKTAGSDSGWSTSSPRHTRSDSPSSSSNGEESYV